MSRVIHVRILIPKQYQMMMSSVARFKNLLKPRSFLGIIPKASQTTFHQIWISKSKSYSYSNSTTKMGKNGKKGKHFFWVTKRGNKGITNWGRSQGLQIRAREIKIGAALGISNRGKKITNWGKDFKSGQIDFKSGQRLQISAEQLLKQCNFPKEK